jgi:hypothetical protein
VGQDEVARRRIETATNLPDEDAPQVKAEGVGFEPTETRNASPVFKTGAIGH